MSEDDADRARVEQPDPADPADPADLAAWTRLRSDLVDLRDARPRALSSSPSPDAAYRRPPVVIRLKEFAEGIAEQLHERHGSFVELTVGALPYPPGSRPPGRRRPEAARTPVDPAELRIEPVEPLSVASGDTTRSDIVLMNLSADEIVVRTNGHVTSQLADPANGRIVGGYWGSQKQPLVRFRADPGETRRIPVLIGTASFEPELGYAVPPGEWLADLPIDLDGRRVLEARLPLTVGPRNPRPVPSFRP